tara:strand:+ start:430 stop:768 length:339 start_codon:yes stop_codon:yes gene_type:complete
MIYRLILALVCTNSLYWGKVYIVRFLLLLDRMFGDRKRTYRELQLIILKTLKKGNFTIYELAKRAKLHFNVVQHQLILLKGQDYVDLVFEHKKFRLFGMSEKGKKYLRKLTR